MLPMPGRLAAKWFGSNELSTATSIGIFGPQLGTSLMFLLSPMIVKNHEDVNEIGRNLSLLFWSIALAATLSFVLVTLCEYMSVKQIKIVKIDFFFFIFGLKKIKNLS